MAKNKPETPESPPVENLPAAPRQANFPASIATPNGQWSFTTIDRSTRAGRLLAARAADWDGLRLKTLVGKRIEIAGVYVAPTEYTDAETGEVTPGIHVCLIDPQGELYQCGSKGVFNSLKSIWTEIGAGPWADPVVCEVFMHSGAADENTLKLRPLGFKSEL